MPLLITAGCVDRGGAVLSMARGEVRLGRDPGNVADSSGCRGAHRATFPTDPVRPPIAATCPPLTCRDCGLPALSTPPGKTGKTGPVGPRCPSPIDPRPGLVLDPFFGSGTVGVVARQLRRDWLGIELNATYVDVATRRIAQVPRGVSPRS